MVLYKLPRRLSMARIKSHTCLIRYPSSRPLSLWIHKRMVHSDNSCLNSSDYIEYQTWIPTTSLSLSTVSSHFSSKLLNCFELEQVCTNGYQCIHPLTLQITASRYSTNKPANRAISNNAISILAGARKSNFSVYCFCLRTRTCTKLESDVLGE